MLDLSEDGRPYVATPWSVHVGLPPQEERTWLTLREMTELLSREGLRFQRELVQQAVASDPPATFRTWKKYEPKHVEMVRRFALSAPVKRRHRPRGGMHGR
jgi:hypothetical protein